MRRIYREFANISDWDEYGERLGLFDDDRNYDIRAGSCLYNVSFMPDPHCQGEMDAIAIEFGSAGKRFGSAIAGSPSWGEWHKREVQEAVGRYFWPLEFRKVGIRRNRVAHDSVRLSDMNLKGHYDIAAHMVGYGPEHREGFAHLLIAKFKVKQLKNLHFQKDI